MAGKMVMSGFISTHDHIIASGWMNLGVQLYHGKSGDDYLNATKEYADAHPDDAIIWVIGWNGENTGGHPTAAALDRAVPDRPAIIIDIFYTDWSDGDKPVVNLLGSERTTSEFAKFRTAVEAGCIVSLGADVPSAPLELDAPLLSVEGVITRRDPTNLQSKAFPPGAKGLVAGAGARRRDHNPAWQIRMEDKPGSPEVGKYADFIVIDQNLFEIGPTDIDKARWI